MRPHPRRRHPPGGHTDRRTLTARDVQTATLETDDENAFAFAESDCEPLRNLARSVRRRLTPMAADGAEELARLIGSEDLSALLDAYFEKRPAVLKARDDPGRFADLYPRSRILETLNAGRINPDHVRILTAGGDFCTEELFSRRTRKRKRQGDRVVEFVERRGGTLNVSRIFDHSVEVASLIRVLNRLFKARISASAFFTGPRGQAFPVHWDTLDGLVFQVEGQKTWTVYEPMIRAPLPHIHYCTRYDLQRLKPLFTTTLRAGDLMVVPRGYAHRARAGRSGSIHVTLGVHAPTWNDFVTTILSRALVETRPLERFRSDCYLSSAPASLGRRHAHAMLEEFFHIARSIVTEDYFLDHWALHAGLDAEDGSSVVERDPHKDTVFHRVGGFCLVNRVGGRVHLRWNDRKLGVPGYAASTLEFMARTPRFRLRDLPVGLTTRGQTVLATKLCAIGFLTTRAPLPSVVGAAERARE